MSNFQAASAPATSFNRVPKVTPDFWLIKVLAVTVGETFADYMNINWGWGLTNTSLFLSVFLTIALIAQFYQRKYVPMVYWITVVLISVVGTLVTDNLVDNFGVTLPTTTLWFSVALALTFAIWYGFEKTLSIHSIYNFRREAFYWLAILFTFALGTAAGDLIAERMGLGYLATGLVFIGIIAAVAFAYYGLKFNSILCFWLAYIFTRPMGASFGDLLSQPVEYGGLGFGTVVTSFLFLGAIALAVVYMTFTHEGDEAVLVS